MKYKVGDKVRIKSLDWYNENKDEFGVVLIENGEYLFRRNDTEWCGKIVTIVDVCLDEYYTIIEDFGKYRWTDEMIEGLVEKPITLNGKEVLLQLADIELPRGRTDIWECPEGYIFKDESGNVINATKIVLEKKKKEYPKTYDECAKVLLDRASVRNDFGYKGELLVALQKLLVCRDAYWKIAGEEMGLGKPWEPDYDSGVDKFGIVYFDNTIMKTCAIARWERHLNKILEFPTEEMRDAFYENFKEDIEFCKELL